MYDIDCKMIIFEILINYQIQFTQYKLIIINFFYCIRIDNVRAGEITAPALSCPVGNVGVTHE